MKTVLRIVVMIVTLCSPAYAGFQMLVVPTDSAVAIDGSTKCEGPDGARVPSTITCTVGPIKTNSIMATWGNPVTTPTTEIGHELAAGTTIILSGLTTDSTSEVNMFRAIASSATSTVPITCTCGKR